MKRNQPVYLPAAPFHAVLTRWGARDPGPSAALGHSGTKAVASRIGCSEHTVRKYLRATVISEQIVDAALTKDGRLSLRDPYPDGPATVLLPEPTKARTSRCLVSCATPGCGEEPTGRFCPPCTERLARVRALYEGDAARVRSAKGRKDAQPSCCRKGCWEPRLRSETYCDACQAAGLGEEDGE